MNHVLPATGLRAVIVRLRATKPQKFGFLRHCVFHRTTFYHDRKGVYFVEAFFVLLSFQ